jgi:purine-binding chemotaxis protein CheW
MPQNNFICSQKFLTFSLGQEAYAVPVNDILEIVRDQKITHVPRLPHHIKGVVNLRGKIVPVMDLREKLNIPVNPNASISCMIVSQVALPSGMALAALIVDAVDTVLDQENCAYEETPEVGNGVHREWTDGLLNFNNKSLTIMNLNRLLADEAEALHPKPN